MKNGILHIALISLFFVVFTSCGDDDGSMGNNSEDVNLSFIINLENISTRLDWEDIENSAECSCKGYESFREDIVNGKYYAIIWLDRVGGVFNTEEIKLDLFIDQECDEGISLKTSSFNIKRIKNKESYEQHILKRMVIVDNNAKAELGYEGNIIYSTVKTNSEYSVFVNSTTDLELLFDKKIKSNEKNIAMKVDMICALDLSQKALGYYSDLDMAVEPVKTYSIPVIVNVDKDPCTLEKYTQAMPGSVYLELKRIIRIYNEGFYSNWVVDDPQAKPIRFTLRHKDEDEISVWRGSFSFSDKAYTLNDVEGYRIAVFIDSDNDGKAETVFGGDVSLDQLLEFELSCYYEFYSENSNKTGYLHFNLSDIDLNYKDKIDYIEIPLIDDICWPKFTVLSDKDCSKI